MAERLSVMGYAGDDWRAARDVSSKITLWGSRVYPYNAVRTVAERAGSAAGGVHFTVGSLQYTDRRAGRSGGPSRKQSQRSPIARASYRIGSR